MKYILSKLVRICLLVARRCIKFLFQLDAKLSEGYDPNRHKWSLIVSTKLHNMSKDPDEEYYARQYWHIINDELKTMENREGGRCLDLGCGQGRFSRPLAKWADKNKLKMIGVDISPSAIEKAINNVKNQGSENIEFQLGNIENFLESQDDAVADVVCLLEVTFYLENQEKVLKQITRVLKPGGLLIASFRSQFYNSLCTVRDSMWNSIDMLYSKRSGCLWGGSLYFNWNTSEEIKKLLSEEHGLKIRKFSGIGGCSGIAGDPLASLMRPSSLNKEDQQKLMDLEMRVGVLLPDTGRYMLAIAEKMG